MKSDSGFGDRIREAMGDESAYSFAQRAGVSASLIRNYLEGTMPGADKLYAIAKAAGVTMEWLAAGEGPMRRGEGAPPSYAGDGSLPGYPEVSALMVLEVLEAIGTYIKENHLSVPPEKMGLLVRLLCEEIAERERAEGGKKSTGSVTDWEEFKRLIKLAS